VTNNSNCSSWFEGIGRNPRARYRLFCFPHVGGSARSFRGWANVLHELEVCPVQLPGREKRWREKPFSHVLPLAQAIADVLPDDKPFAFLGHSMGALLSFELAKELRRRGRQPVHLFLSALPAPELLSWPDPPLHTLPDDTFVNELKRLNGIPDSVLEDASLMQMWLPTLRADYSVAETYVYSPEPPLDCPISTFAGEQDSIATRERVQKWSNHTSASFSLATFPGGHFFLYDVAPRVSKQILQALGSVPSWAEATAAAISPGR
jgi:medium-chain acyl-[acyl-carrier-protein] hydrolase